ncbi:hypothetical protein BH10ACI4_BH10ACI4_38790 [soil metagenome]
MFSDRRCGFASVIVLAILAFLVGAPFALPQALTLVQSSARYAGNGSAGFNGDFGSAATVSLSSPSYIAFDSYGNQFISDTLNNCIRKIDTAGNVTTVAGLIVPGQADTCNTASTAIPTSSQGLYKPTGIAIDSTNRLYIADSMHNCIRALAANTTGTANLVTAVGMCTSVPTDSIVPQPSGLAVDPAGNLYISLQDSTSYTPVNQVVRHTNGTGPISACILAGARSTNLSATCAGVTNGIALVRPSGLALNISGDLYIADTGNNCVREVAGLAAGSATQTTAIGQCLNDGSGSSANTVRNPYGIAISPTQTLYVSESNPDVLVSFVPGGSLRLVAGLASGSAGAYDSTQDGKSALSTPLNGPHGIAFDPSGRLLIADSLNNITRALTDNIHFPNTPVGSPSASQPITFAINQTVNLTTTAGTDFSITSTTCNGALTPTASGMAPTTCQVFVRFTPTRPGLRRAPVKISDSVSSTSIFQGLQAVGTGALSIFTPPTPVTIASNLASPATVATDAAGNAYVLETSAANSAIRLIPAAGGASTPVLTGLVNPTAIAADAAGNWFVADSAHGTVARYGADGAINTSYLSGLDTPTALQVDLYNNLYIAQAGTTHNVILAYTSGARRIIAGGGSNPAADGVTALSAAFVSPSALTMDRNGALYVADQGGHRVYSIDNAGIIHAVAGNGSTATTLPGQAKGTALVAPTSLAVDAAGDLHIAEQSSGIIYTVYAASSNGSNIAVLLDTSSPGLPNGALSIALDGSSNLFVSKRATNSVVELAYTNPTLDFGTVQGGVTSAAKVQTLTNVGTDNLNFTSPVSTTDSHFAVDSSSTTCGTTILTGSACTLGFTFTPTANTPYSATSILNSNSYNAPQPIALVGIGKAIVTPVLTLPLESTVYGQGFNAVVNFGTTASASMTSVPTGTLTFTINGQIVCSLNGTLAATTNCSAPASGLSVGTYAVTVNYSGDSNFAAAAGVTTLTVTPAPLSEVVSNAARMYGAANPAFSGTLTGVVSGDTFLVSFNTTAVATSPAGSYPLTATLTAVGSSSLANYTVTNTPGTLTVTPLASGFSMSTNQPELILRRNGSTSLQLTATSTGSFTGKIALSCSGLPADATCTFSSPTVTLTAGGSIVTTVTVTAVSTNAALNAPSKPMLPGIAPITIAAVLPGELTGFGVLLAGFRRRRKLPTQQKRLLLTLFFTIGILGLMGCGSSVTALTSYTVNITGTSLSTPGFSQSTSVVLAVAQK